MLRAIKRRDVGRKARLSAGQKGQALIEFALVSLFLMLLIIGVMEMFLFIHTYNVMADSAKEGVRYAIVHGGDSSSASSSSSYTNITSVVKGYAQLSMHDVSAMTVNVTYNPNAEASCTPTNMPPCAVQVVVSYTYSPLFGLPWFPKVPVSAAAEGRIVF